MKNFFSLFHFKDLRILLSIELIIVILISLISMKQGLDICINQPALISSLICWSIASIANPKGYFNFFTLLAVGTFGYGVFWLIFTFLPI